MLGTFLGREGLKYIAGRLGFPLFKKALEGDMRVRTNICFPITTPAQVLLVTLCGPWESHPWSPHGPLFMSPVQMSPPWELLGSHPQGLEDGADMRKGLPGSGSVGVHLEGWENMAMSTCAPPA